MLKSRLSSVVKMRVVVLPGVFFVTMVLSLQTVLADNPSVKTWLSKDISLAATPPDDLATADELAVLRQRVAGVSESDKANVSKWVNTPPNHHWLQTLLTSHIDIGPPSPQKGRAIALLNLAIYDAVAVASSAQVQVDRPGPDIDSAFVGVDADGFPSIHAAAATSASQVLSYLLPENAALFERMAVDAHRARLDAGLNFPSDIEAGAIIGQQVAAQVIEFAKNDNSDLPFEGERPEGPGYLKGDKFVYPTAGETKTVSVKSVEPHLPGPPPAYDSPELAAEIEQLKAMDRPLPGKMMAWIQHSTTTAYRWWYDQIAMAIFERGMQHDALATAHIYASVSAINHDALIACFKSKYEHWQIRPGQLDASVPMTFPSPPHPSYPSAHSCSSTSYGIVSSHFFPEKKDVFMSAAEAGGLSRLYAGIHYPSDDAAGDSIGESVAEEGLAFSASLLTGNN